MDVKELLHMDVTREKDLVVGELDNGFRSAGERKGQGSCTLASVSGKGRGGEGRAKRDQVVGELDAGFRSGGGKELSLRKGWEGRARDEQGTREGKGRGFRSGGRRKGWEGRLGDR